MNALRCLFYLIIVLNCCPSLQAQDFCDLPAPILSAGTITCTNPYAELHLAVLPYNVQVEWFGPTKQAFKHRPSHITEQGWYFVKITELGTKCSRIDSVFVEANTERPTVKSHISIQSDRENNHTYCLSAIGSSTGAAFIYNWFTDKADIELINENKINAFSKKPGTFTIRVTNTLTGCAAESTCSAWDLNHLIEK